MSVEFPGSSGVVRPVLGVDLELDAGEMVGLVGESGCGKTLTALAMLDLVPAPGRWGGQVRLDGAKPVDAAAERRETLRGRGIGMIFQEPGAALDPIATIGAQLAETVRFHRREGRRAARALSQDLLARVAIGDPRSCLEAYPHQLSGGQRQRAVIALALACEPRILLADEPTTALDVTVQAEILGLLERLRAELGLAILLITHDLAVVAETCDRLYVMYSGSIVEEGPVERVLHAPLHPYTRGLIDCIPRWGAADRERELRLIPGQAPTPEARPTGCAFHPRCAWAEPECRDSPPSLAELEGRRVACWRAADVAAGDCGP